MVVVALDRLGRSLAGIVRTVETLRERRIMLRSLREGIDYSTPVGRMVAGIFASLAGYERELIHERAAVARQAARARGKRTGRPRVLTADRVRLAQRMREAGEPPVSVICTALKVARSTLYRALGDVERDTTELTAVC
ncbi:MAG TPA: recombinase family protein [Pseudonocardiaceae bacterium]|nr:recombinase family protein [Pseudonocardiaceae bacterium]